VTFDPDPLQQPLAGRIITPVPVHGRETPICAYAAMGSWPI
jgi:hypothetical protein